MRIPNHEKGFKPFSINNPEPDDNWPYRNHPHNGDDRQYGVKSPKFERHIYIRKDELFFDIETQLNIIAKMRRKDDGTEESVLTGATSTYHQMFVRWIDKHIGEAKTVMSAFVLERFKTSQTNSIKDTDEVDITLLLPDWYDDTTFPQLCTAVHDYVVNATLFDFLSMTLTSKDPVSIDKNEESDKAKYQIKKLVNAAKPGRISKPFKPF